MFFKSIRFKITILYMAILALTLTSFSFLLYHNVSRSLYANMDTLLKSKAGGITRAINTYWEASNLEAIESGVKPSDILRKRRNFNFAKIAQKWVREESNDPQLVDIIVQVFDTDGASIASSKNRQGITQIPARDFLSVLQGNSRLDTVMSGPGQAKMALKIFTTPVFEDEKVAYIVQVSSPLISIQDALNNLKVTLFILFPVTVLATGVMGAFLAKVTLRPVDNMIHTIHQITAENMKLKLDVPSTKDEIQKLAETFNSMLGRLEQAFLSQKKLFGDLSHELKTPLTILKGEFEVALKKVRTSDDYESLLKSALEEIDRITKLAESLLLLARLDSKEVFIEKKNLDLGLLVQAVVNNIKWFAQLKQIGVSLASAEGLFLNGDENQLKTLFLNVLDNAVKYTPPKGEIKVTLDKDRDTARVRIQDTGLGISEEEMCHIFDRFYRIKNAHDSAGFGLGLSITKSIAEAHGGSIKVESTPGKGSAFTIRLPLASLH